MTPPQISFIRHYYSYSGGHQKVRDYVSHFLSFNWKPNLHLVSKANVAPPLFDDIPGVEYVPVYAPATADIAFLAGMDWRHYLPKQRPGQPVINLIQHVKHATEDSALFGYLEQPALRLCVSDAVKDAISPYANGPCETITMGHQIPRLSFNKQTELYIQATKQPELGLQIYRWAKKQRWNAVLHDTFTPRNEVLEVMAKSKISLVLPNATEGFYLPGIEAMALSDIAVVPYCVANTAYCKPFSNAFTCSLNERAIISTLEKAKRTLGSPSLWARKWCGQHQLKTFSLDNERKMLYKVLKRHDFL